MQMRLDRPDRNVQRLGQRLILDTIDIVGGNQDPVLIGQLRDRFVEPVPQFEIHFLRQALNRVLSKIGASGHRALVHPLTDDDLADHTSLATWVGAPLTLDLSPLDPPGKNQGVARFGKTDF